VPDGGEPQRDEQRVKLLRRSGYLQVGASYLAMNTSDDNFDWPKWSTWALVAIVVTALVTIAATLNDIW
jgi:hypothetical protein